jgi:hypothetical protein
MSRENLEKRHESLFRSVTIEWPISRRPSLSLSIRMGSIYNNRKFLQPKKIDPETGIVVLRSSDSDSWLDNTIGAPF